MSDYKLGLQAFLKALSQVLTTVSLSVKFTNEKSCKSLSVNLNEYISQKVTVMFVNNGLTLCGTL